MRTERERLKGTNEIPGKYSELVVGGWEPTPVQELQLLILGVQGHGKTTFGCSNPDAWILDFEGAAGNVRLGKAKRVKAVNMPALARIVDMLVEDAGRRPCKHLVFDTVDKFMELTILYLTDQINYQNADQIRRGEKTPLNSVVHYGDRGAGWYMVRDHMMRVFTRLSEAGYGWTALAHEKTVRSEEGTRVIRELKPVAAPSILQAIWMESHFFGRVSREDRIIVRGKGADKVTAKKSTFTLEFSPTTGGEEKALYREHFDAPIPFGEADGWSAFSGRYAEAIASFQET